jgi:hypothetical protein
LSYGSSQIVLSEIDLIFTLVGLVEKPLVQLDSFEDGIMVFRCGRKLSKAY